MNRRGLIWRRRSGVILMLARVLNVFPLLFGIGHLFRKYQALGVNSDRPESIVFALLFAPAWNAWFGSDPIGLRQRRPGSALLVGFQAGGGGRGRRIG